MKVKKIKKANFEFITCQNDNYQITFLNLGASIYQFKVKDEFRKWKNIVLTLAKLEDYGKNDLYAGATIGRNANRIAKGSFELNHQVYQIEKNDHLANLHGGSHGLHQKYFKSDVVINKKSIQIKYTTTLLSSEDQYPGNLKVRIIYTLLPTKIKITYLAISDRDTICNLTNHTYFNLNGFSKSIASMIIQGNYQGIYYTNEQKIPIKLVKDTFFDFDKGKKLGDLIFANHPQVKANNGLDHPFVVAGPLILKDETQTLALKLSATHNQLFIYTQGSPTTTKLLGHQSNYHCGIACEFQEILQGNNINQSKLLLKKGQIYRHHLWWEILQKGSNE